MAELTFRIEIPRPAASELSVRLQVPTPRSVPGHAPLEELTLFMPTWTPGSYLIREFSKHVVGPRAFDGSTRAPLPCVKVAKNRWMVTLGRDTSSVDVEYTVYCHELSVRTADVTPDHAYWNNACVLLWPVGQRSASADITVCIPTQWSLATSLPVIAETATTGSSLRNITIHASDMDRAFDCPCLAGSPKCIEWSSLGVPHRIVLDDLSGLTPPSTLAGDLDRIVSTTAKIFGGTLPYGSYTFLCLLTQAGHGGLEHLDSTTLLHSRTQLATRKGYLDFLSLAAHELFHAWNVKRLRPSEFVELDYEAETFTPFLWLIEGWTAYYDDLICLRAGVFSAADYLTALGKNIQALLNNPGRLRTSLAESSFDAWIRLYRPDENTRNSSQNYYGNGAVAALCLDLLVRAQSDGTKSLDDIIRSLYETMPSDRGYALDDVLAVVERIGGQKARDYLVEAISGPFDPPLREVLAGHGIGLTLKDTDQLHLGLQFEPNGTVVASVGRNSAAWMAGVMPGDEILAVGGLRVDASRWSEVFTAVAKAQQAIELLISRRGVIKTIRALPAKSPGVAALEILNSADDKPRQLRDLWLQPGAVSKH